MASTSQESLQAFLVAVTILGVVLLGFLVVSFGPFAVLAGLLLLILFGAVLFQPGLAGIYLLSLASIQIERVGGSLTREQAGVALAFVLLFTGFAAANLFRERRAIPSLAFTPSLLVALGLVLSGWIGFLSGQEAGEILRKSFPVLFLFTTGLSYAMVGITRHPGKMIAYILTIGIFLSLIQVHAFWVPDLRVPAFGATVTELVNKVRFCFPLAFFAFWFLAKGAVEPFLSRRVVFVALGCAVGIQYLLEYSRRGAVGLILGVLAMAWVMKRYWRSGFPVILVVTMIILVAAGAWATGQQGDSGALQDVQSRSNRFDISGDNLQRNLQARINILRDGLQSFLQQPWGYGPAYVLPYEIGGTSGLAFNENAIPDNGYIHLLLNFSPFAAAGFVLLLLRSGRSASYVAVHGGTKEIRAFSLAALSYVVYVAVTNLAASDFRYYANAAQFPILAGMIFYLYDDRKTKRHEGGQEVQR